MYNTDGRSFSEEENAKVIEIVSERPEWSDLSMNILKM